jgi:hypothetical protein
VFGAARFLPAITVAQEQRKMQRMFHPQGAYPYKQKRRSPSGYFIVVRRLFFIELRKDEC